MSRSTTSSDNAPLTTPGRGRWKRGAAMLAAATTVVATAGVIAPLAARASITGVVVAGKTRPIVSFTDTNDVVTLSGLSNATSQDTATFTQSKTGQATGYYNYNPLYSYKASADSTATATPSSSQPFDLVPTALPPGYYDIEVDNFASGNSEGTCTACIFVTGATPTITGLSQTTVAAGATVGATTPTADTSQFAIKGTNFNHDAAVSFDNAGITFVPQVNGTTYTDEGASGLTVRYGQLKVAASVPTGPHTMTLTDGDGGTATTTITVDPQLTIASIYPKTVGNGDTGRLITVVGSGITSSTKFATSVVNAARTESASGITIAVKAINSTGTQAVLAVTVPTNEEAATDTGSVSNGVRSESLGASNPDSGSASIALPVNGASPTISSVETATSVSQTTPGSGSQSLTIIGANFVSSPTVAFLDATGKAITGITVGTPTYNSATSLTVPVTFASTAATQVDAPTVINPDGGTGTCSNSVRTSDASVVPSACFQVSSFVISGNQAPISNSGPHTIPFTGTGFTSASTFTASLVPDPMVAGQSAIPSTSCTTDPSSTLSSSKLSCAFDTTLAAPVTYDVIFTRTTGSTVDSDTDPGVVNVTNPGKPTITAVAPATIVGADLARTVTITGTNFANGAVVKSSNAAFTFGTASVASATSLTVPVTLAQGVASGTGTFTVTDADATVSAASTAITIGAEPTVTVTTLPTSYTIGNTGFSVPVGVNNTATGSAALTNEQVRLRLTGLTGLTPSQVVASVNGVSVTPTSDGTAVVVLSPAFSLAAGKSAAETFVVALATGAPSGSLNVSPLLGDALGTTVYPSTMTSDTQASAASFAVAVAGPPPSVSLGAYPTQLVVNDPAVSETLTVVNNSGTRLNEGQLDITVSGPGGLTASQVNLTSTGLQSSGQAGTAAPVALTYNNGLKGVLAANQIIPSGSTYTDTVTLALPAGAPFGAYSFVATLDETDQNGNLDGTTLAGPLTQNVQGVGLPSAPTALSATPGNGSALVSFGPPANSGGDGPLTYAISATADGQPTVTVKAAQSPVALSGLTNGVSYTIFVQAENALNRFGPIVATLVTPVAGATATGVRSISASLSKAFAPLGTRVTLSGKLVAGTAGVANAPVTIQTTYSDGKVVKLGTVTTKADGTWSYTFEPLYNGYLLAMSGTTMSKPVGSRVIVVFTKLAVTHSGNKITVKASTAPGFVTSPKRLERAQILIVNGAGKILKVLAIVNAANRHSSPGQAHGVNDVSDTFTLPAGRYQFAVKIIGTPVNTGAQSASSSAITIS